MNLNLLSIPKKIQLSRQAEQAIETLEQQISDLKGGEVALFLEEKFNEPAYQCYARSLEIALRVGK